ncbi:hypothetical protein CYLTODRAFT_118681 [Cylindrobasidium torrendii FP15055 ss-10]|uniref:Uncharacterized protein n=1 Tax=Cylindrobasidium torrendii FP15055 ss-10 TaxID=1314674 RepID=A0A0D7B026_9AGAR|nr:hypothetical protein CYLTODRAFT_118681 [Cylindrobasidium torrendii FP15055 ss-10]
MGLWEHPAIRKRMRHLAQQRAKMPGSAAEKAAAIELMGVPISRQRPDLPPFFFQDYYQSKILTPQKPKGKDDERMGGQKVINAALEMSLWMGRVCGITFEHLQHACDISHTLAFSASDSLRHSYEHISGQHLDSMHVDSRFNKFPPREDMG